MIEQMEWRLETEGKVKSQMSNLGKEEENVTLWKESEFRMEKRKQGCEKTWILRWIFSWNIFQGLIDP